MATQLLDSIVPTQFDAYLRLLTEQKSLLVRSGVLVTDDRVDNLLAGGGYTFHMPAWNPLADDTDNVGNDTIADIQAISASGGSPTLPGAFGDAIPKKITALDEVGVALHRNQVWSAADIVATIAGSDPIGAILADMASYWAIRQQHAFVDTWRGVSADNGVNYGGDYAFDVAGANGTAYNAGVTDFSADRLISAEATMGDSMGTTTIVMVHSTVYTRMLQQNLIDTIPDARGEVAFQTFLGRRLIVDDAVPSGTNAVLADGTAAEAGVFETWLFKAGAARMGTSMEKVPFAFSREELAGNGAGQENVSSRKLWAIHPRGHAYTGASSQGGPTNATLALAATWNRVYPQRKMIGFARLVTRES